MKLTKKIQEADSAINEISNKAQHVQDAKDRLAETEQWVKNAEEKLKSAKERKDDHAIGVWTDRIKTHKQDILDAKKHLSVIQNMTDHDAEEGKHKNLNEAVPTEQQLKRVQQDWSQIAGEKIEVEYIKGVIYGYGSELGTMKIDKKYRGNNKVHQGYSQNLKKHYISLELSSGFLNLKESLVNEENRPPKAWWDKMTKEVKSGNPKYSEDQVNKTVGEIWYHKLSDSEKEKLTKANESVNGPVADCENYDDSTDSCKDKNEEMVDDGVLNFKDVDDLYEAAPKEGSFTLYGKEYKTKIFSSDEDANVFLEGNEEYSVIGTKGEEGKPSYEVHVALTDDLGESLKLSKRVKLLHEAIVK